MILEEFKNIKSSKPELKKFGLTVGVVLLIISTIIFIKSHTFSWYFIVPGILLILAGLIFPVVLKPFHKIWMGLAVILGWVSTRVILSLLFYLVMFPIRLFSRITGKDFLELKIEKEKTSYWNYRKPVQYSPENSEKQY